MDDTMIDSLAGDPMVQRRLEAFAAARLAPDTLTTRRIRARVMAQAHRRAADLRADSALHVMPTDPVGAVGARGSRGGLIARRLVSVFAATALAGFVLAGVAFAARPGGALYETRIWIEAQALPSTASAQAVAQLDRLALRLDEAGQATAEGDHEAAAAALAAYARIVEEATDRAVQAGDPVASAALEAGLDRNVAVLDGLLGRLPAQAVPAVSQALERAIERSTTAAQTIHDQGSGNGNGGGGAGNAGSGGNGGGGPAGGDGGNGNGNGGNGNGNGGSAVDPTRAPTPTPAATHGNGNDGDHGVDGTPRPTKPPKPTKAPK